MSTYVVLLHAGCYIGLLDLDEVPTHVRTVQTSFRGAPVFRYYSREPECRVFMAEVGAHRYVMPNGEPRR